MSDYLLRRRGIKQGTVQKDGPKPPKPIAKMSAKRKEENKELKKIVQEKKGKHGLCQIKSPVCSKKVQGSHHIVKRSPKNLLDPANILLSCNPCNLYLETNVEWAKERGFVRSKFKKDSVQKDKAA